MKIYDKLVRDNVPNIIELAGKKCDVKIVSDKESLQYLYKKLDEEINELLNDENLDEVADIMEVLFAIANRYGYTDKDVLDRREQMKISRGGFEKNIVLNKTY